MATTMVMRERENRRATHVLVRGQYDKPGKVVAPGIPSCLPVLLEKAPSNRLELARWLVHPQHPLTARVIVNRMWAEFFGRGIVETVGDFGVQGSRPTHPELLDYLAEAFVRSGWDVKAMHRLIVTSATYRQASAVRPDLADRDPDNRLLARMTRRRLTAEMLRDAALHYGGLLVLEMGGPGVYPYQPEGLWKANSFRDMYTAQVFVPSEGPDLYRRSVYTFWKRTCPPPNMTVFDAPSREWCTLRRSSSNTPLQALVLLNDPVYVEAARALGQRVMRECPSDEARIERLFAIVVARPPSPKEGRVFSALLEKMRRQYRAAASDAQALRQVGDSSAGHDMPPDELAAWTILASTLLNTDEAITRN